MGPKTTEPKSVARSGITEAKTKGPETSDPEGNSTPPPKARYSRRQLLALGMSLDGSRSEKGGSRSKSTGHSEANIIDRPGDFEYRLPQEEVLPAMLPGFNFYLENYEKRTQTQGRHDQDYPDLVREFQRTMTPLFQKYLNDRITQLIEKEGGPQLVRNKALQPKGQEKPGDTPLKGHSQLGDTVAATASKVDRSGTSLSLESQLPRIFAHNIANNKLENIWVWNSDLLTTRNDTGNFWRLAFFAVSFSTRSATMRQWWLIE